MPNMFLNPERSLKWLGQPEAKDYFEWLTLMLETNESKLRTGSESFVMYRAQGAVEVLNKILSIKEDLLKATKPGGTRVQVQVGKKE